MAFLSEVAKQNHIFANQIMFSLQDSKKETLFRPLFSVLLHEYYITFFHLVSHLSFGQEGETLRWASISEFSGIFDPYHMIYWLHLLLRNCPFWVFPGWLTSGSTSILKWHSVSLFWQIRSIRSTNETSQVGWRPNSKPFRWLLPLWPGHRALSFWSLLALESQWLWLHYILYYFLVS